MPQLLHYDRVAINKFIAIRAGEEKLGEKMEVLTSINDIENITSQYIIVGIPEEKGVVRNMGMSGTATAWLSFLKAFLNIQHNSFFNAADFALLGYISVADEDNVNNIDDIVSTIIHAIILQNKIPIVIGGGHNNAYGLLKGSSTALQQAVNVINLDPHADLRTMEERHSGNGFSFALKENYLNKYALLGLHKAYNNQFIIDQLDQNVNLYTQWFEDIFIKNEITFQDAIDKAIRFVSDDKFGVELDIDAIENTLSSAMTPVGISPKKAMQYLYKTGKNQHAIYLHLPEAVYQRADGSKQITIGKLLSYLVQSFYLGQKEK